MTQTYPGLEWHCDEAGICELTLDRPQARNALSLELMSSLSAALDEIAELATVRVVILGARGPAFCAGHDLKELRGQPSEELYQRTFNACAAMMRRIIRLPQPVIARVQGIATAAGCQLVATCDLAVAADHARFATPGVNIGLFCSTPMVALSRNVGRKQAMHMLLTGDMVDAHDAQAMGLINHSVGEDNLKTATYELAQRIANRSKLTVTLGKRAFYRQLEMGLEDAYEYTGAVMVKNMLADDAAEGIDAFLQKREPVWQDS